MDLDRARLDRLYEDHLEAMPPEDRAARDWGYSFFYCPAGRALTGKIGVIGLNPGGGEGKDEPPPPKNRSWDHPGFAYLDQPWGPNGTFNPLQVQIARLLQLTPHKPEDLFAAQLVPFRSPSWSRLAGAAQAIQIFEPAWRELFKSSSVRLWFALGYVAGDTARTWLGGGQWTELESGWGRTKIKVASNADGVVIVALPHLSRYKLFSQSGDRLALAETAVRHAVDLARI